MFYLEFDLESSLCQAGGAAGTAAAPFPSGISILSNLQAEDKEHKMMISSGAEGCWFCPAGLGAVRWLLTPEGLVRTRESKGSVRKLHRRRKKYGLEKK